MLKGNGWDRIAEAYQSSGLAVLEPIDTTPAAVSDDSIDGRLERIEQKLDDLRYRLWDKESSK
jgi:hypothetical protein